jgi:3-oxoacyl-[acyl-carrier protein] reductase
MSSNYLFITGGSGDIGKAIINEFIKNNYKIIAPSSKELDCSSEDGIKTYFSNNNLPNINSFVHCAGWNKPQAFTEISNVDLLKSIFINSFSFIHIVKFLSNNFIDNDTRLSAISSLYGSFSRKNRLAYTSSKHSLNGVIKELSLELGERGILCNTIAPGFIETKMTYQNNSKDIIDDFISRVPLKKLGKPDDVARITYFLTSINNTYINGQNIVVDGGYSIGGFQNN